MIARVMMTELRRGPGWRLAAALVLGGVVLTVPALAVAEEPLEWSASGPGIIPWLSTLTLLLGPVVAATGAWVGGRERRLRIDELVAAGSRPGWQRYTTDFTALAVAAVAGLLVIAVLVFATVAIAASYAGGRWYLSIALLALGLVACLAAGLTAGRLLPYRWTAPLVALVCYLVGGSASYVNTAAAQLVPIASLPGGQGWQLRPGIAALGAGWLLALTAAVALAGAARRRWLASFPAALAVLAAVPLTALPVQWTGNSYTAAWAELDPGANEQVCTTDAPTVCVRRVHADLLPQVTAVTRIAVGPVTGYRFVEEQAVPPATWPSPVPGELTVIPALSGRTQPFTNTLRDSDGLREEIKDALVAIYCPDRTGASDEASRTASALLDGEPVAGLRGEAAASWLDRYLRATQSCDMATFAKLTAS